MRSGQVERNSEGKVRGSCFIAWATLVKHLIGLLDSRIVAIGMKFSLHE
jgi:hypothetical protein